MSASIDLSLSPLPLFRGDFAVELRAVFAERCNVLLEGPEHATEAALLVLQPRVRQPVVWRRGGSAFDIPTGEIGMLFLKEADALTPEAQKQLLEWLDIATPRRHIASTSSQPLFARVAQGTFNEALYYRLNVVLLRVGVG